MKWLPVLVELDSEKLKISIAIDKNFGTDKEGKEVRYWLVKKELHSIDIFDWSSEKICESIKERLQNFFDSEEVPGYTFLINKEEVEHFDGEKMLISPEN